MTTTLRVLLMDDSRDIGEIVCRELKRGGYDVEEHHVRTADALGDALTATQWDVIISNRTIHALRVVPNSWAEEAGRSVKDVAHDFNNLLTSIIGGAELSLGVQGLPDEVRTDLESIRDAGKKAAAMTRALVGGTGPTSVVQREESTDLIRRTADLNGKGAAPRGGQETVLVVEDEAPLRSVICRSLEQLGYEILEAEHGEDALRVLHEHHAPIHLLVTDLVMPEMGGSELGRLLHQWYPNVRVLFASGHGADKATKDPVLIRQSSYLPKPFTIQQLAEHVRELLDRPLNVSL